MPWAVRNVNGYQVSSPGGVKAKRTTKEKAESQINLLRAVEHGDWRPTGKKRKKRRKKDERVEAKAG